MWLQRRENKSGEVYYSFFYQDEKGRRIRLKRSEHPHFTEEEKARAWANSQEAYRTARSALIQRKLEWKKEYFDFTKHAEKFTEWQKGKAPNSWERGVQVLEQDVLPWFLEEKHASNLYDWPYLYPEWKAALEARVRRGEMAYSTVNKHIHVLNALLQCLREHGDLPEPIQPCRVFPNRLLASKDYSSVITEDEYKVVLQALKGSDYPFAADMFIVLYHTGMRLNEAFSLPMDSIFPGKIEGLLGKALEKHDIAHYGYIYLESQLAAKYQKRESDLSFKRKPLKSKPRIHPKYSRTIPISDKECWNVLVRLYKAQKVKWEKQEHGLSKANYLLFDGFIKATALRALHSAYEKLPFTPKTWHDCRHSFCTHFAGRIIGDTTTPRMILGHTSKAIERYMHIYEQVSIEAKKRTVEIEEVI